MKTKNQTQDSEGSSPSKKPKLSKPQLPKKQEQTKKPQQNAKSPGKKFDKTKKPPANGASTNNKFNKNPKPPYDKVKNVKNAKGATAQEKPADWNQFKKEKKELRLKRKASRSLIDVITKAKAIGEKIRVKKLEGTERTKLVNELHQLLGNQGSYVKFVLSHDMARIVQYMLKFGSAQIREEISAEIIPSTLIMLQSKYGKFVVKRMLKYTNHEIRAKCIQTFYSNAVKLTSHAVSAPVFEYAYNEFATPLDKINLIQEFFGDMYKQTKDANVKHLRDVYKTSKDLKAAALGATKANLQRILNKDLLDSGLVQSVISQFLSECSVEDRTELIAQLAPHIVVLSNSKDGAKAAMICFWHGTNKDRKAAMKAIKEHIMDMCKHEHAHAAIICLLDSADDTVLLNKAILSEIIAKSEELIVDDWGRRVLAWIVAPGDRKQFHPQFIKELEDGRKDSNCKKDTDVRRREIIEHCAKDLFTKIAESPRVFCLDPKHFLVTSQILKIALKDDWLAAAGSAFKGLAELLVDLEVKIEGELYIENSGINMSLKKLIQNDKVIEGDVTFGNAIVNCLTDDVIAAWIKLNRGCFLLADIYSNNKESTQGKLKELLTSRLKKIKAQKTKGAEILLQKIS